MMIELEERTILMRAVDIAAGYLVATGYDQSDARGQALRHIGFLFKNGERRPLMLANKAIEKIEAQNAIEGPSTIEVSAVFSRRY